MPSQVTSRPLKVTVLAALWVTVGLCDLSYSPGPGCDNGKLYLDRDLSVDAVYWSCSLSAVWSESPQRPPSIDTVYDPEPARQLCMDQSISYSHTIPNSGAYRPVPAEPGEYVYCPPQRWLNNLHNAATVLLYHPCAPLHDRLLLSVLARSCLPDYIITPHPQLNKHMPIALVSWGRTLELSTVASSSVCGWLETMTSTRSPFDSVSQSRKYNLLLTWSAEQQYPHPEEHSAKMKKPLRRCCEQTISSLLNRAMEAEMESNMKKESLKQVKKKGKKRLIRAAIRVKQDNVKDENKRENTTAHVSSLLSNQTNRMGLSGTEVMQNYNTISGSSESPRTLSDHPGPAEASSQSKIQNINQGFAPISNMSQTSGSQNSRITLPTATALPSTKHTALRNQRPIDGLEVVTDGVNNNHKYTARFQALAVISKDEGTLSGKDMMKEKHSNKDSSADVKERELEHKHTHRPQPLYHLNPLPAGYLPNSHNCNGCTAGEQCECNKDSKVQAIVVNKGLLRTPRTDEAVWAAAALGFLLVLLTLSVLHTRLYRHWRTMPSLYWHDPQQDYDSVADVIRRRLRIAKRRRKRGRRQECVLLPSSSSSDEYR